MGGMLTPYGNPQNLYLFSYYNIPAVEFFTILLKPAIIVATLLFLCCLFVKNEPLSLQENKKLDIKEKEAVIYLALFVIVILTIFRYIPYLITLLIVLILILIMDRELFKDVDFPLLATFFVFFIFSGNMARIPAIKEFISQIVNKNTLLAGIVSCQFISNVPTSIFLSKFTSNYTDLLIAVNIGSLGVLISSLASLITLKEFLKHQPKKFWEYIGIFTFFNTLFFIILLTFLLL
jgi:di/tricarboxylate transporter